MPLTYEEESAVHTKREEMRKASREQVESIFRLAEIPFKEMWELANGYWPLSPVYDDVRRPWWLVSTSFGPVRIGWRKRVLSIDWTATGVQCVVTDDVTKGADYVHAYSVEKAIEYLRRLREAANAKAPALITPLD